MIRSRARHFCQWPGCRAIVAGAERRCAEHDRLFEVARRERLARHDAARPKVAARGYGARWRRQRWAHLAREPLCRACLAEGVTTAATDVDHIVPLALGGSGSDENLQSLCKRHHTAKTLAERVAPGRQAGAVSISGPPTA